MKKLGLVLFGYRDDLDLAARWWHRLLKVVFVVLTVAAMVMVFFVVYSDPPVNRRNVIVIETLANFNNNHPELPSSIEHFERAGRVGRMLSDGAIKAYYISTYELFCSGNLAANVRGVRDFIRRAETDYSISDADAAEFMKTKKLDDGAPHCIGKMGTDRPKVSEIVTFRFTKRAIAQSWIRTFTITVSVFLSWLLLWLNVYYRGLVYVVCGARKTTLIETPQTVRSADPEIT